MSTRHATTSLLFLLLTIVTLFIGSSTPTTAQNYSVLGYLWVDANGNGVREAGEGTIGGTRVFLMYVGNDGMPYTADDQQIDFGGASSPNGLFYLTLGGGGHLYYLAILGAHKPVGYVPTLYRQGNPTTDSDLLPRTDLPAWVTDTFSIDYGQTITGIDLGLKPQQAPASQSNLLYLPLVRQ